MLERPLEPPEEEYYYCPVCGAKLCYGDEVYIDGYDDIIGCVECIRTKYAEDVLE